MIRSLVCLLALFATAHFAAAEDVTFGKLKSKTPASWKAEPAQQLRMHTFSIPKAKGDDADAELAIFFFGVGGGGGIADNLKRWKGFFEAPKGKSIDDVSKVETFKVGKAELTYLDISGTYLSKFPPFAPNAKVIPKANHRMLAVAFDCEDGPFFIRLTGPSATVAASKSDFDAWLKNFK
jgi:hypothetical protein